MKLSKAFKNDIKSFRDRLIIIVFIFAIWYSVCGFIVQTLHFEMTPGYHFTVQGTITILVFSIGTVLLFGLFFKTIDLYNYIFVDEDKEEEFRIMVKKHIEFLGNKCVQDIKDTVGNDLCNVDSIDREYIGLALFKLRKELMDSYIHVEGKYPYIALTNDFELYIHYSSHDIEPAFYSNLTRKELEGWHQAGTNDELLIDIVCNDHTGVRLYYDMK